MCKCNPAIRKAICPKCYITEKKQEDWFTRLLEEREELHDKTYNLSKFINSPAVDKLSERMRHMLFLQQDAMRAYLDILNTRIAISKTEE